jgi:hypothetical protein
MARRASLGVPLALGLVRVPSKFKMLPQHLMRGMFKAQQAFGLPSFLTWQAIRLTGPWLRS